MSFIPPEPEPYSPRQVVGTVSGRVVFKNITVRAKPPSTSTRPQVTSDTCYSPVPTGPNGGPGCFSRQGIFSSIKPSLDRTINYAREKLTRTTSSSQLPQSTLAHDTAADELGSVVSSTPPSPPACGAAIYASTPAICTQSSTTRAKTPNNGGVMTQSCYEYIDLPDSTTSKNYYGRFPTGLSASEKQLHRVVASVDTEGVRKYALVRSTKVRVAADTRSSAPKLAEFPLDDCGGGSCNVRPISYRTSVVYDTPNHNINNNSNNNSYSSSSNNLQLQLPPSTPTLAHRSASSSIVQSAFDCSQFTPMPEKGKRGRSMERSTTARHRVTLSSPTPDDYANDLRRQSIHTLNEVLNIRQTDFKTGAHHSTPHRGGGRPDPTSVIASTYVGGPETPGSGLEHASSSSSASPHQDSYDVQLRQQQQQQHDYRRMRQSSSMTWVETPPHTLPTTTFGTDPQIRHVGEDAFNAYNELSISTDPDPHSVRHSDGINWDDHLANKSSMSNNSGNWSSAGTTTTATSGNNLPTIFAQNGSNKIAVPPQQQRKSSQMRQSTSNQSNFRYSDTPVSRQNMVFQSAASVASPESISQNLIMKEMYIGKLEAQVRSLASQSEQQQIEFDSERQKSRRDAAFYAKCRHRLSVANETIEKLQDERNEEVQRHAADVQTLKDTIRQRDDRIAELLSKMTTSMGVDDVRKFKEEIGELQTKISALKKALEAKDRRISMLEESEGALRRELAEAKAECKSNSSGDERGRSNVLILPHSFDSILKNHYKKIQICSDIASRIVDSSQLMATGEKRKALQTLGWITDTEAEESEAIVSTAPDAPSKMTLVAAERYVRRECEMLDKLKDKLQGVVELYVDLCKKTDISQQQQNGQGSASSTRSKHHNRV